MSFKIRRVDYFYSMVEDQPGEAYKLLAQFANIGINLVAFNAVPVGPMRTQLMLFPEDTPSFTDATTKAGVNLDGPHRAILVQGDDELGALASIHAKLYEANINIYASSGVSDGKGSFGYVIHVRVDQYDKAAAALEV